jgi:ATP-dependent metalloprotease FtsH
VLSRARQEFLLFDYRLEFVDMFVGVGAARVRDRGQPPAIVFIDELDALGRARGIDLPGGGHDEKEQTLNQLLAEMDGFDPSIGIVVLAATNRPEILDPALLRAGRFDRQVLVDRPDRKGRVDILRVHLNKISVAPDLDVDAVASLTPGFTGADLANLVNEAALVATRRGANATTLDDFTQAIERIVAGLKKKSRILSPREREIVAHHEMGHALVALALPGTDPVQKVSIIPRGIAALGYTLQRPTEDRFLMSRSELANRMAVLLGGRAAENLVYAEVSTGVADDLARATDIARNMVVRFGMTAELGQVAYEPETGSFLVGHTPMWRPRSYGDGTAEAIDHAVKTLIDEAYRTASAILEHNRSTSTPRHASCWRARRWRGGPANHASPEAIPGHQTRDGWCKVEVARARLHDHRNQILDIVIEPGLGRRYGGGRGLYFCSCDRHCCPKTYAMGLSAAEFGAVRPRLEAWLTHVFQSWAARARDRRADRHLGCNVVSHPPPGRGNWRPHRRRRVHRLDGRGQLHHRLGLQMEPAGHGVVVVGELGGLLVRDGSSESLILNGQLAKLRNEDPN